ncbi:putative aconitate hydratase [Cystobasidium minutum MCA 4210]|uniref:putative aconitate hydratase n=1 Tax=Cystobasidium minutum MCA 4210 TaxID=1397322 RepID=UPI0034CE3344|eukprot:jgi/Rhomi1/3364/CE3363_3387
MPVPRLSGSASLLQGARAAQACRRRAAGYATHATQASGAQIRTKDCSTLIPPYEHLTAQLERVKSILKRPLTLSEKIVYSHLCNVEDLTSVEAGKLRGEAYLKLRPDRVALQDASAQMALLQFATCGSSRTAVPTSIHCDHLISAYAGAEADLKRAVASEKEVFNFLESAARKFGIEFWGPGSGIIHSIVLENYSAPGLLMLGCDSHTPNAGGLGAIAIGVGGADAVDAMTNTPWECKAPKMIGIELKGKMSGWTTPKDLILHIAGKLTVKGGTGHILEYYGPGLAHQSCTGLATIANMGAEVGATTSCFPYNDSMRSYLHATGRGPVANAADKAAAQGFLQKDEGAEYDQHITVDLSELEPHLNGPHTPDLATPLSKFGQMVKEKGWQDRISASLIGSCTNSSYEDLTRVASIAKQAEAKGLKAATPFMCTPGSELINATIERDGLKDTLESVGATVLANACGPCIGQWDRSDCQGEENAILTSFNRNFRGRNDANKKTMNFLASPDIVTAMAFSGKLSFNPITDTLLDSEGKPFKFEPPSGLELPPSGFTEGNTSYLPTSNPEPQPDTEIVIDPSSSRLELLQPFAPHWTAEQLADQNTKLEFENVKCLLRVRGKCTTDEISAAGPWLKYKGHLSNISENTLIGATNDQTGEINQAIDYENNGEIDTIPEMAKKWKSRGQPWFVVTDTNYGEGSAREHAALQPRHLGGKIILARSFARIHETNLKKQGVLPLTFKNQEDYSLIDSGDDISTEGLNDLLRGTNPDVQLRVKVNKKNGETKYIDVAHTMSPGQLAWLKAGSALNLIAQQKAASA